jgi:tetratricopeptide (TPR) repeat protein
MLTRIGRTAWVLAVALVVSTEASAQTTRLGNDTEAPPQRLALLVGNSNYEQLNKLKNPKNDVDKMEEKLAKLGFKTTVRYDLNHDQFVDELAAFTNEIEPGAIALFYYSGHGMQVTGGTNYLLPINLPANANPVTLQGRGIPLSLVRNALNPSKLSVIILDACRTIGSVPAKGPVDGLAAFTSRGSLIAYAADEGQTASDNDAEDTSLFTKFLVAELDKHDETLCPLFSAVRQAVDEASQHAQFPFIYDGVIGDFVFNKTATAEARNLATAGKSKAWTMVQGSDNPNDFVAYLSAGFSDNKHSKLAEGRLSSLMSATAKAFGVVPIDPQAPPEDLALANQGSRLFYEHAYEPALKTYKKIIDLRPSDSLALYNYATCLLYLSRYNEAIAYYSKAADLNHEGAWSYLNRGVANHLKGRFTDAISDYTLALKLRPKYALGYNNLALAKRQNGDLQGAELDAQKAIELDPNYAPAYFNQASIHSGLGDGSLAMTYFEKGKSVAIPKM